MNNPQPVPIDPLAALGDVLLALAEMVESDMSRSLRIAIKGKIVTPDLIVKLKGSIADLLLSAEMTATFARQMIGRETETKYHADRATESRAWMLARWCFEANEATLLLCSLIEGHETAQAMTQHMAHNVMNCLSKAAQMIKASRGGR